MLCEHVSCELAPIGVRLEQRLSFQVATSPQGLLPNYPSLSKYISVGIVTEQSFPVKVHLHRDCDRAVPLSSMLKHNRVFKTSLERTVMEDIVPGRRGRG